MAKKDLKHIEDTELEEEVEQVPENADGPTADVRSSESYEEEIARLRDDLESKEKELAKHLAKKNNTGFFTSAGQTKTRTEQDLEDEQEMKRKLGEEPKVPVYWPLTQGEKIGASDIVSINGYRYVIKKGEVVNVPQSVAAILQEHINSIQGVEAKHPLNMNNQSPDVRSAVGL